MMCRLKMMDELLTGISDSNLLKFKGLWAEGKKIGRKLNISNNSQDFDKTDYLGLETHVDSDVTRIGCIQTGVIKLAEVERQTSVFPTGEDSEIHKDSAGVSGRAYRPNQVTDVNASVSPGRNLSDL
eukprot:TRINITY_DN28482_c0_g1_i1.p1 TRINITY_DN28482_c0_g1~~TRINITY_DN28482_c0_g1_i1.p1  ORF type:complete len:127 (-),score=3.36 TRINITY_DN28482_c0_g1_i1:287-667(-)